MVALEIITQQFNNGPRKARDHSHVDMRQNLCSFVANKRQTMGALDRTRVTSPSPHPLRK